MNKHTAIDHSWLLGNGRRGYVVRDQVGPGKHRAIRNHVFVPHPRGDDFGCNLIENDQLNARCGFYRQQHPTMECGR